MGESLVVSCSDSCTCIHRHGHLPRGVGSAFCATCPFPCRPRCTTIRFIAFRVLLHRQHYSARYYHAGYLISNGRKWRTVLSEETTYSSYTCESRYRLAHTLNGVKKPSPHPPKRTFMSLFTVYGQPCVHIHFPAVQACHSHRTRLSHAQSWSSPGDLVVHNGYRCFVFLVHASVHCYSCACCSRSDDGECTTTGSCKLSKYRTAKDDFDGLSVHRRWVNQACGVSMASVLQGQRRSCRKHRFIFPKMQAVLSLGVGKLR